MSYTINFRDESEYVVPDEFGVTLEGGALIVHKRGKRWYEQPHFGFPLDLIADWHRD